MPQERVLKNGMKAILVPQKGATSATVMVFVKVGARYETKKINGVSHFVEHLMFKGTKRRPDNLRISKELDRYGAEYNAYTGKDQTVYYIKIDAKQTALAVDMLHDMLFHSLFEKEGIDRERGVIVEEINMYEDNPRMHIEDLLEQVLFPGNTLGWNIAGPREVIKSITREELMAYHRAYYNTHRINIVVAGCITKETLPLLEKTFGTIAPSKEAKDAPFTPFEKPETLEKPFAFQIKKTEQFQLGLAFHGLPYGHKQLPAIKLLATILGGTMSSRLFTEIREKRGLCYSISASHQSLEDSGAFSVMAGLDKTRIHEAVRVIWKELHKTTQELVSTEELRRAKDHVRGRVLLAFEDSANQADWYGKQWMFEKKLISPEERLRLIERVTKQEIRDVAKALFKKELMASAVIGPFKNKEEVAKLFKIE